MLSCEADRTTVTCRSPISLLASPLDDLRPLIEQRDRLLLSRRLGPQVSDRFGGIGKDEDPSTVRLDDSHTVGRVKLALPCSLDHGAHDHALGRPRSPHVTTNDVRVRDANVDLT